MLLGKRSDIKALYSSIHHAEACMHYCCQSTPVTTHTVTVFGANLLHDVAKIIVSSHVSCTNADLICAQSASIVKV
jgi:hypothetical protein